MEEEFLHDTWQLWFHDPTSTNWDKDSYVPLGTISTVEEFCEYFKGFEQIWDKGMFFLMREHILPIWEDPANENGGCFSFKINTVDIKHYWFELCACVLGENAMQQPQQWENICGISISPKWNYSIVRVWIADDKKKSLNDYKLVHPSYSSVMFKAYK